MPKETKAQAINRIMVEIETSIRFEAQFEKEVFEATNRLDKAKDKTKELKQELNNLTSTMRGQKCCKRYFQSPWGGGCKKSRLDPGWEKPAGAYAVLCAEASAVIGTARAER